MNNFNEKCKSGNHMLESSKGRDCTPRRLTPEEIERGTESVDEMLQNFRKIAKPIWEQERCPTLGCRKLLNDKEIETGICMNCYLKGQCKHEVMITLPGNKIRFCANCGAMEKKEGSKWSFMKR